MSRPSRAELLLRFFPELRDRQGSAADQRAALTYNTLACEVVLADQLRLFDAGRQRHGAGALAVRLQAGGHASGYVPVDDLQADREQARKDGDRATEAFLDEVLDAIGRLDPGTHGLVLLIDNSRAQLLPVPREHPASAIAAMLEDAGT
jgi:hypothetical protein